MDSTASRTLAVVGVACLLVIPYHRTVSAAGLREEAIRHREEGAERIKFGDLAGAMTAFQKAAIIDPSYALPHNDLGLLFEQQGDFNTAKRSYERAILIDPNYLVAHLNLATLHERFGNKDQALFHWVKAGLLYEQQGDLDSAKAAFQKVLDMDPNNLEALMSSAMLQGRQGNRELAVFQWVKAGLLYEQQGDMNAATRSYERALVVDPEYVEALSSLALLYDRQGNTELTIFYWLKLGLRYEQRNELDAARRAYERALALNPNNIDTLANLAMHYERVGDQGQATSYWQKCRDLGLPNDPWTVRAEERLVVLGALKSGQVYHRHVVQQELLSNEQTLDEFRAVTEQQQRWP